MMSGKLRLLKTATSGKIDTAVDGSQVDMIEHTSLLDSHQEVALLQKSLGGLLENQSDWHNELEDALIRFRQILNLRMATRLARPQAAVPVPG